MSLMVVNCIAKQYNGRLELCKHRTQWPDAPQGSTTELRMLTSLALLMSRLCGWLRMPAEDWQLLDLCLVLGRRCTALSNNLILQV